MALTQSDINTFFTYLKQVLDSNLQSDVAGPIVTNLLQSINVTGLLGYTPMNTLITANRQTASYTLVASDSGKIVEMNSGSANNLTVPPNSSVPYSIGTQIVIAQYGAGQTSIVAGVGVTIRSKSAALKISSQYSAATLVKIAADEWYLFGDITA